MREHPRLDRRPEALWRRDAKAVAAPRPLAGAGVVGPSLGLLFFFLSLAALLLWSGAAVAAPAQDEAWSDEEEWLEEETDELPDWVEEELDDARAALSPDAGGIYANELQGYGADIPNPEDVVAGSAPGSMPRQPSPPAPQQQAAPSTTSAPAERVEFEDFRVGLEPHGRWVNTAEYGRVFIPHRQHEIDGWRPYLYGQWVWTSYGWTWVSEEPFGWATYHYGRWAHRPSLGWIWVPGYTWGPAWVVWRHGDGVVGWAPLYPGYLSYGSSYPFYANHWVFVAPTRFYGVSIHHHWYRDRVSFHYSRTKWTRNWKHPRRGMVYHGPPRRYVEQRGSVRIHQSRLVAVRSPDRRGIAPRGSVPHGEVRIYRPTNRGAVRPGRPEGRSRGAITTGRPAPRVGSGLSARELPAETRRELSRPSRSGSRGSVREARPSQRSGSQERGNVRRARPSQGSGSQERGNVRRERPSQGSGSQERGNVRRARPSQGSGSQERGNVRRARPSQGSGSQERGNVRRARPSQGSASQERGLRPSTPSPSQNRGVIAPRPSTPSPSQNRGAIAPRSSTPSPSQNRGAITPRSSAPSRSQNRGAITPRSSTPSRPQNRGAITPRSSAPSRSQNRSSFSTPRSTASPRSSDRGTLRRGAPSSSSRPATSNQLSPARSSSRSERSSRAGSSRELRPARRAPAGKITPARPSSSKQRSAPSSRRSSGS